MELDTPNALYIKRLRDLYSAETQLIKALPKMQKAASNDELRQAFEMHLAQTERQVERLTKIFEDLNISPKGKHCRGMEGLLAEADQLIGEGADTAKLDAGLIASAQGVKQHTKLLRQTLSAADEADRLLSKFAMSSANRAMVKDGGEVAADRGVATLHATEGPKSQKNSASETARNPATERGGNAR